MQTNNPRNSPFSVLITPDLNKTGMARQAKKRKHNGQFR